MNTQTPHARHRQLRDVAILVASLDEAMAQRLLDSMPSTEAAAVLAVVDELDYVDPEEQQEIVDKFRRSITPPPSKKVSGVELDASLLAKLEDNHTDDLYSTPQTTKRPLETLSESEAAAIIDMLSAEHPQTIAIVLSRIEVTKAADLMSKLSVSLQAEVFARLGNLDAADEHTVRVVESQLATWIEQQRQRTHRQTAGMELVQRILDHTPEAQRQTILAHMGRNTPTTSAKVAEDPVSARATQVKLAKLSTSHSVSRLIGNPTASAYASISKNTSLAPPPQPATSQTSPTVEVTADPLSELEQTDEATLMKALSQIDRKIGALALAGASDALMKRIMRGLPRKQAKTMQQQLRTIGPTKLSDMLAAQQQLLLSVRQVEST